MREAHRNAINSIVHKRQSERAHKHTCVFALAQWLSRHVAAAAAAAWMDISDLIAELWNRLVRNGFYRIQRYIERGREEKKYRQNRQQNDKYSTATESNSIHEHHQTPNGYRTNSSSSSCRVRTLRSLTRSHALFLSDRHAHTRGPRVCAMN